MIDIKIETNREFKVKMLELGFKKDKFDFFNKPLNDCVQSIGFGHASHIEVGCRYYFMSIYLQYPQLQELAMELNTHIYDIGTNVGYIMPQNKFIEWRLSKNDSAEFLLEYIDNMIFVCKQYAIPFMDMYTTLEDLHIGLSEKRFNNFSVDPCLQPILLRYLKGKDAALIYLKEQMETFPKYLDIPDTSISNTNGENNNRIRKDYMRLEQLFENIKYY